MAVVVHGGGISEQFEKTKMANNNGNSEELEKQTRTLEMKVDNSSEKSEGVLLKLHPKKRAEKVNKNPYTRENVPEEELYGLLEGIAFFNLIVSFASVYMDWKIVAWLSLFMSFYNVSYYERPSQARQLASGVFLSAMAILMLYMRDDAPMAEVPL